MTKKVVFDGNDIKYVGVDIASWIDRLDESNSRLHKEAVIEEALVAATLGSSDAQAFLNTCYMAYNPFLPFQLRQVPTTESNTDRTNPWPEFWALCHDLSRREITGNAARDAVADMSEQFDSVQWNRVCRPMILKDLRVGISEKTVNKIVGKTDWRIPIFSCQLAASSDDNTKFSGMKRIERKLDGSRMLVIFDENGQCTGTFSRNGKEFNNFGLIATALTSVIRSLGGIWWQNGLVFDGEVMSDSFQNLMRQAQRKTDVQTDDCVYHIFDVIPLTDFKRGRCTTPQYQRSEWLETRRERFEAHKNLHISQGIIVDTDSADGMATMRRYAEEAVADGFEGIMIKAMNGVYSTKRTNDWIKWKPVYDYDLTVVDIEEGTGKNAGMMGALVCEGVDGDKLIRVNVGSGFTDEQRAEIWQDRSVALGLTAVVLADAITQNQSGDYSLRFPRFKTFREDK